jgi:hypothetical protein
MQSKLFSHFRALRVFDANYDYQFDDFTVPDDESIMFENTEFEDDDLKFESDATIQKMKMRRTSVNYGCAGRIPDKC